MTEVLAELAAAGVATVYEAYGRRGLIAGDWKRITKGRRAAGPARIASCAPGDNRAVHEVMSHVQPGDILVLTTEGGDEPTALFGDLLATQAQAKGATGALVSGAVRDCVDLEGGSLCVLARWRHAKGATKDSRGQVNVPVVVGGTTIRPGDIVVLDDDGAVSIAAADVADAVRAVRERIVKEAELRSRWARGELSYDVYGMRAEDAARERL